LAERLIAKKAINIHMGTSPYYRGSSCNFWAMHDGRPEMVGATLHLLSKGLDSGAILFHAFPRAAAWDTFELGTRAVAAALEALVDQLREGAVFESPPLPQDPSLEIRYTRNADFTDAVAGAYLEGLPTPEAIGQALQARPRDLTERAIFV
jgi:methionyl-tRNA formyltransferase